MAGQSAVSGAAGAVATAVRASVADGSSPELPAMAPEFLTMVQQLHTLSQAGSGGKTFALIEGPIVEVCRRMGLWAMEQALASHPQAHAGTEVECPRCGRRWRILRPSQHRNFRGRLGSVSYNRDYGTCDRCKLSGALMDWELGLPSVEVSIGVLERVCHAAVVTRSFEDAGEIMKLHDLLEIAPKQIRVLAEGEGRRLAQERQQRVKAYQDHRLEVEAEGAPALLVVGADGGRVQTRNGFAERGQADKGCRQEAAPERPTQGTVEGVRKEDPAPDRWKEDKVGVIYDAVAKPQPNAAAGEYRGAKAKTKTYEATMQPWDAFGWMLRFEAERRGYGKAKTRLFLADGAKHIREMKETHFTEAVFILDWPHGAEHIAACAKALFGQGTDEARGWYREYRDMLWNGKRDELIAALQAHAKRLGAPREDAPDGSPRKVLHQNAYSYFPNNRDAIDYPSFRAKGWPIGSGVVESAVKQFALRLKGSDKFWNVGGMDPDLDLDVLKAERLQTGAEEMLALCALYHSEDGRWQRHWRQRGQPIRWK